jgi:hypothetical protein
MKAITLSNLQDIYKCKQISQETAELKGYELIEELFVDSSGFGAPDEAAYTQPQFMRALERIIKDADGKVYACITNAGQFQVYIGLFSKVSKSKGEKIANNTLRIENEDGYSIRLHDTNILTFKNGSVTLYSGGWQTKVTKERINAYLPGFQIKQKNFEWTVVNTITGETIPFEDGMTISL